MVESCLVCSLTVKNRRHRAVFWVVLLFESEIAESSYRGLPCGIPVPRDRLTLLNQRACHLGTPVDPSSSSIASFRSGLQMCCEGSRDLCFGRRYIIYNIYIILVSLVESMWGWVVFAARREAWYSTWAHGIVQWFRISLSLISLSIFASGDEPRRPLFTRLACLHTNIILCSINCKKT